MQRGPQTTVVILAGMLAMAAFAVTPSEAQGVARPKVITGIPCKPIVADSNSCQLGRLQICRHFAQLTNGRCNTWQECKTLNRPCLSKRPRPRPASDLFLTPSVFSADAGRQQECGAAAHGLGGCGAMTSARALRTVGEKHA